MSILKAVNVKVGSNACLKGIINYVLQPKKTEEQLTTGFCCEIPKALETFMDTKKCFGKLKGRQYYHFVQSFPPNEKISAQQAHDLAVRFAEKCKKFWGFEMIIVTHKDREHIHTHFVMNSVSFIDGHKFHITRKELASMKEFQNQLSIENGYSEAPKKGINMFGNKRTTITANNSKTFKTIKKAEEENKDSYLKRCKDAILESLKMAITKEQFLQLMHAQGFITEWSDNKKNITFTDIKRKQEGEKKYKVRLYKLAQYFPSLKNFNTKENLLNGIQRNSTVRIEPDNNRSFVATNNSNKSKNARSTGHIDFNTGFKDYSSRINRERIVRAATEITRQSREFTEAQQRRITEQQTTTRLANEPDKQGIQQEGRGVSERNRNPAKKITRSEPDYYSW